MKLSIVIVNYNVKYFLEQCLSSVLYAIQRIDAEVFVVDNNSSDHSKEYISEKFPTVTWIQNAENVGFSRANNQAIRIATGEYILLLNPDTVVPEDCFQKCISFMDSHKEAGALGIHMIDGAGNFLPESKRGITTPWVSFCKMSGLTALFSTSTLFSEYYKGYLPKTENNPAEILSGAFMFMRKTALEKTGLLDEDFFMYGEDIDLSYRIEKAGFKNYYFAESAILHYKGESTKTQSVRYVRTFYEAMILFAKKHFTSSYSWLFTFFIRCAIIAKGSLSVFWNFFYSKAFSLIDFAGAFIGIELIKNYWATHVKMEAAYYPAVFSFGVVPSYILCWIIGIYFSGGYDRPWKYTRVIRGIFFATLFIAAVYGILPESLRFSRAIILLGAFWISIFTALVRLFFHAIKEQKWAIDDDASTRLAIVGSSQEATRALLLLEKSGVNITYIGRISPNTEKENTIGNFDEIHALQKVFSFNEVIVSLADISYARFIETLKKNNGKIQYKTLLKDSDTIVGSQSKNTTGELFTEDMRWNILSITNKRNKRLFDVVSSILLSLFLPFVLIFSKNRRAIVSNIFLVLFGCKTWVGFYKTSNTTSKISFYKKSVFYPTGFPKYGLNDYQKEEVNMLYARDYNVVQDMRYLWQHI